MGHFFEFLWPSQNILILCKQSNKQNETTGFFIMPSVTKEQDSIFGKLLLMQNKITTKII